MAAKPRHRQTIDFGSQERINAIENFRSSPEWKLLSFSKKVLLILDSVLGSGEEPEPETPAIPDSLGNLIENFRDEIIAEQISPERLSEIQQGDPPCDLEIARIALGSGLTVAQVESLVPKPRRKKHGVK